MNKREQKLVDELRDKYTCRLCGAVHYPSARMPKTLKKLVDDGVLERKACGLAMPWQEVVRIR